MSGIGKEDIQVSHQVEPIRIPEEIFPGAGRAPSERQTIDSSWLDFANLPGCKEHRILRSVASAIGLRDPYFWVHEGDAGASTTVGGRRLHNFSSYDYLGFNHDPAVRAAAQAAIDRYGVSASAPRGVAGAEPLYLALEAALADHYRQQACVTFASGHNANVAALVALLGPKDLVLHDALAHNSIVMGAQMSRAARRSFPHNDLAALDAALLSVRRHFERALIVVEGHYSMDGDVCDLPALLAIKQRHHAGLMIDDAHGLGVLGSRGLGVFEHFNVDPREVDVWMGTLSKTLAGCGGFIAAPTALIDVLKTSLVGCVDSVALPPAIAAAAHEALQRLKQQPDRVRKLHANARHFRKLAGEAGLDVGRSIGAAIVPIVTGSSIRAVLLSQRLFLRGVNVQPIIYPAIQERLARLRFFLSCEHSFGQIEAVVPLIAAASQFDSLEAVVGMAKSHSAE